VSRTDDLSIGLAIAIFVAALCFTGFACMACGCAYQATFGCKTPASEGVRDSGPGKSFAAAPPLTRCVRDEEDEEEEEEEEIEREQSRGKRRGGKYGTRKKQERSASNASMMDMFASTTQAALQLHALQMEQQRLMGYHGRVPLSLPQPARAAPAHRIAEECDERARDHYASYGQPRGHHATYNDRDFTL
jgi:hypothetical protein